MRCSQTQGTNDWPIKEILSKKYPHFITSKVSFRGQQHFKHFNRGSVNSLISLSHMVCYNGPVLPLQGKSTHRSQVSKESVCVLVRFYLWTLQLEHGPSIPFPSMWLMTRLMLAVFLNSIGHLILLLFCSETGSLTELTAFS